MSRHPRDKGSFFSARFTVPPAAAQTQRIWDYDYDHDYDYEEGEFEQEECGLHPDHA
jgi:hypothetical protein